MLIRRRLHIFGRRSMVDVANYGGLRNLMASEPIQELITKMWFGGLEPEGRWGPLFAAWLLPPIAPFMLPPGNVKTIAFLVNSREILKNFEKTIGKL